MDAENARRFNRPIPSWLTDEAPSEEECRAAAEGLLERGYGQTTVIGPGAADDSEDVYGEVPPVGEYRLSTRPSDSTDL